MRGRLLFIAGLLTGLGAASVYTLLSNDRTASRQPAIDRSMAAALDRTATSWSAATKSAMHTTAPPLEEATARLEQRLTSTGGNAGDWQLLAQSYDALGRSEDAKRARARIAQ